MRIRGIEVSNFRSLVHFAMKDIGNFNILVGRNGAGKSNILDAIDVFLTSLKRYPQFQDVPDSCWTRQSDSSEISFSFELEFTNEEIEVPTDAGENNGSPSTHSVVISRTLRREQKEWSLRTLSINDQPLVKDYQELDSSDSATVAEVLKQIAGAVSKSYRLLGFSRFVAPQASTPGQRVPAIPANVIKGIISLETAETSEADNQSYELEEQFERMSGDTLAVTATSIRVREGQTRIPLELLGVGIQTTLGMVHDLLNPTGVILIEEPEIHLHAGLQRQVLERLKEVSERCQVFITTHSTIFLDECEYGSLWHVRKTGGVTTATRVEGLDDLRSIVLGLGIRPSDVLAANSILLVEGLTEKIVIPFWARLVGKRFEPPKVNIVQMGGVGTGRYHLHLWKQMVSAFKIPFFILLDGDEAARREAKKLEEEHGVNPRMIYTLKKESIEDYYPDDLTIECLENMLSLPPDQQPSLHEELPSSGRARHIDKFIKGHKPKSGPNWKVQLAKCMVEKMRAEHLDDEIRELILQIDDVLGQSS